MQASRGQQKAGATLDFRSYAPGDEKDIAELFETVYGRTLPMEFWSWRIRDNPAGPAVIELAWDGDRLAAHYLVTPLRHRMGGRTVGTAISGTTMTHPGYRGLGLFPQLAERTYARTQEEGMVMVWGFPNTNSHRGFIRDLGWADIYEVPTLRWEPGANLARADGLEELDWSDPRLDDLWEQEADLFPIAVVRDGAYLRWRYGSHPTERYRIVGYPTGKALGAWAVWKEYQGELQVIDLLSAGDPDCGAELIRELGAMASGRGLGAVTLWLNLSHPLHGHLEKLGFRNEAPVTYFGARVLDSSVHEVRPYEYSHWHLTRGDSDVY